MAEFFKGWRRKLGLTTLVIACALMGIWIRSQFIVDYVALDDSHSRLVFVLENGCVIRNRFSETLFPNATPALDPIQGGLHWESKPYQKDSNNHFKYVIMYRSAGIEFSEANMKLLGADVRLNSIVTKTTYAVSLLWMILPLTLFSTRLILWKPGKNL